MQSGTNTVDLVRRVAAIVLNFWHLPDRTSLSRVSLFWIESLLALGNSQSLAKWRKLLLHQQSFMVENYWKKSQQKSSGNFENLQRFASRRIQLQSFSSTISLCMHYLFTRSYKVAVFQIILYCKADYREAPSKSSWKQYINSLISPQDEWRESLKSRPEHNRFVQVH